MRREGRRAILMERNLFISENGFAIEKILKDLI